MRIIIILITAGFLHVSAATFAQHITLNEKNAKLTEVIKQIRIQSGYQFVYRNDLLDKTNTITIQLKDATLDQALQQALQNQPFTYNIEDGTVIIQPKEETILDKLKQAIAAIDVTGRVTDENNQPLSGATINEKGTNNSTTTDANGFFTLKQTQPNATIVISFIGYDKKEILGAAKVGAIKLIRATSKLDEVKVIAYGQTTERLSTGNVTTITAKDIEKQPYTNPMLALEGQVPGLLITQNNGLPGAAMSVIVQGKNSINYGTDPFYVIDGVPYSSILLKDQASSILGNSSNQLAGLSGGNPLSFINPSDIESISILKDAEATAIYGSRAGNGAILITTKKGKAGSTKVDIGLQQGWAKDPKRIPLMNTAQYLDMRKQALKNDGITAPSATDYDLNGLWDQNRYTDWQKMLLGGTAHYQNYNASISGGGLNTQFFIGSTFHKETTIFPGDFADQKANLHLSLINSSDNKKFNLQFTSSYQFDDNQLPVSDLTSSIKLAPNAPALQNSDGSLNWAPASTGTSSFFQNPLVNINQQYASKTNNLISNLLLSYEIINGLKIKGSFGYNLLNVYELTTYPTNTIQPEYRSLVPNNANYTNNLSNSWIIEPQLSYVKAFGQNHLDVLLGATAQQLNNNGNILNGSTYLSDDVLSDIRSAATVTVGSSIQSTYKYNAIFTRLNYNWGNKYLLNLSIRRDGSSRFGSANEFHNFGALSTGWVFTEEKWINEIASFLSFGKITASYGITGNDQIGDYNYLNLYRAISTGNPYQGKNSIVPSGLTNPYLQWEETRKLNMGLDLGFLHDRLLLNTSFFQNKSSNELLTYSLPIVTGFAGVTRNFPATIQNTGIEVSLRTSNITNSNFKWSSNLTLTIAKNKLIEFKDLASSSYANSYIIGQPTNIAKVTRFAGVDPSTGLYQFISASGALVTTPNFLTDATSLVNRNPKYYGGLSNHFSYNAFEIDILLNFVKQIRSDDTFLGIGSASPGHFNFNQPITVLNAWTKPGDVTDIAKYSTSGASSNNWGNARSTDAANIDASYVRVRNVSLSWHLPAEWTKKVTLKTCTLYLQGQNLLTITKYKGLDPESAALVMPPLKMIVFGFQIEL